MIRLPINLALLLFLESVIEILPEEKSGYKLSCLNLAVSSSIACPAHLHTSLALIFSVRKTSSIHLRGGRSSRAKRPPPKAIGEERLLRIVQLSEPSPASSTRNLNLNASAEPAKSTDLSSDQGLSSDTSPDPSQSQTPNQECNVSTALNRLQSNRQENDTDLPAAGPAADCELSALRASVMQRVAALFPAGVNITALALGDEQSASSLEVLRRAILHRQQQEEERRGPHLAAGSAERCPPPPPPARSPPVGAMGQPGPASAHRAARPAGPPRAVPARRGLRRPRPGPVPRRNGTPRRTAGMWPERARGPPRVLGAAGPGRAGPGRYAPTARCGGEGGRGTGGAAGRPGGRGARPTLSRSVPLKLGVSPATYDTHTHTHTHTTWGFPGQFIKSTKVFMTTPQERRLGYHTPEQVSNQEPPDSRPCVLT